MLGRTALRASKLLVYLASSTLALASGQPASASALAIVGTKLYPSPTAKAQTDVTVVLDDGKIVRIGKRAQVRVPRGAKVIDGRGKVLLAGFWNSHVHIFTHVLLHADQRSAADLSSELDGMLNRWGFTSVFDVGSFLRNTQTLQRRIRSGEVRGPNILTVGEPFFPPDGVPIYVRGFLTAERLAFPEVTGVADALARERTQIAAGADGVKLFTGDIVGGSIGIKPMDPLMAKALVSEAHRRGLPVFAHPTNREGIEIALNSGVDILAHTADQSGPWDPALIRRMIGAKMAVIPTFTLFEWQSDHDNAPAGAKEAAETLVQGQLRAFRAAGGQVLFGTDIGYIAEPDTRAEFRLMAAAGLNWRAILSSLTVNPARRFGAHKKGSVKVGNDADLVLLNSDPAKEIGAFADVDATIAGGKVIYRAPSS